MTEYTEIAKQIIEALQNKHLDNSNFVSLIPVALAMYALAVYHKKYSLALMGLAFFLADICNELWNTIVMFASGYAPVWGTPVKDGSTLILLPGWTLNIVFMFLMGGIPFVLFAEALPFKNDKKFLGLNLNQWIMSMVGSTLAIVVEKLLNMGGLLTWEWHWWGAGPWYTMIPVFMIGYLWFFIFAFNVYNIKTWKNQLLALGSLVGINLVLFIICLAKGWIL
jgi:hypothetical protein